MKFFAVIFAILGAASAGLLAPTIVNRVAVAPAQVTVVRQPITVAQPEPVLRAVPVPIRAVSYTAPAVVPAPVAVAAPAVWAAPSVYAAPAHW